MLDSSRAIVRVKVFNPILVVPSPLDSTIGKSRDHFTEMCSGSQAGSYLRIIYHSA